MLNGSDNKYGDQEFFLLIEDARLPADFLLMFARFCDELISFVVLGVLLETLFDGLQYCFFWVFAPQGFPVRVSTHFSALHRFKDEPALLLRTLPFPLRHFAIA